MLIEIERRDVTELVKALRRVEWVDGRCPWCGRRKDYGLHMCSCPRRLALRAGDRLLGTEVPVEPMPYEDDVARLITHLREATGEGDRVLTGDLGRRAADTLERLTR